MSDKIERYELVDVEGLSNLLAQKDWDVDTKDIPVEKLHETIIVESKSPTMVDTVNTPTVIRHIKPYWATHFFLLKDKFLQLIKEFTKQDS